MKKAYIIALTLITPINLWCMNSHEANYTLDLPEYTSDDDNAAQMGDPLNPFELPTEYAQALLERIPAEDPVDLPIQQMLPCAQPPLPQPRTALYKCTQCPHTTKSRNTLITHAIKSHVQQTLKCPKCDIPLPSKYSARRHIFGSYSRNGQLNRGRQALWDRLQASAKKQALQLLGLKISNKTKPREKIECPYPGCTHMVDKRKLPEHIQAQHIKQHLICPDNNCDASYLSWNGLRMHIQSKHGRDQKLLATARHTWNQTLQTAKREARIFLKA